MKVSGTIEINGCCSIETLKSFIGGLPDPQQWTIRFTENGAVITGNYIKVN